MVYFKPNKDFKKYNAVHNKYWILVLIWKVNITKKKIAFQLKLSKIYRHITGLNYKNTYSNNIEKSLRIFTPIQILNCFIQRRFWIKNYLHYLMLNVWLNSLEIIMFIKNVLIELFNYNKFSKKTKTKCKLF